MCRHTQTLLNTDAYALCIMISPSNPSSNSTNNRSKQTSTNSTTCTPNLKPFPLCVSNFNQQSISFFFKSYPLYRLNFTSIKYFFHNPIILYLSKFTSTKQFFPKTETAFVNSFCIHQQQSLFSALTQRFISWTRTWVRIPLALNHGRTSFLLQDQKKKKKS